VRRAHRRARFATGVVVLEALEKVNRELGTLTVLITHNAGIADMADRVIRLSDGRIVEERRNRVKHVGAGLLAGADAQAHPCARPQAPARPLAHARPGAGDRGGHHAGGVATW
jgi:ABC-type microcin C transport system duplicated ATPase subunit YejF